MNFLDSQRLLPGVAGFAISAFLLWLGSEVFAAARQRAESAQGCRLKACALLLAGLGLWWPGHFLAPLDAAGGGALGIPFVAGALAWVLAGLAIVTAVAATRKTLPAFAGLAVVTLLVAYGALGVRDAGTVPRSDRVRRLGPGLAVFDPGDDPGRAWRSNSAPAASSASCASPAPCSAPRLLTLAAAVSAACRAGAGAGLGRGAARRRGGRARADDARRARRQRPARRRADAARRQRRADGRQPDPAADAGLLRGPPRRRRDQGRRQLEPARAALHRPRRLQAGQRHLRPLDRRPRPRAGRPAPEVDVARQGRGRPGRRRRVPAAAHQRQLAGGDRPCRRPADPGPLASLRRRGPRGHDLVLGRDRDVPRRLQPRQADRPRRRGDVRVEALGRLEALLLLERDGRRRRGAVRAPARPAGRRSSPRSSSSSTSRRSTPRAARSPRSRRCCAGSIRPAACSCRAPSSRSPSASA